MERAYAQGRLSATTRPAGSPVLHERGEDIGSALVKPVRVPGPKVVCDFMGDYHPRCVHVLVAVSDVVFGDVPQCACRSWCPRTRRSPRAHTEG